MAIVFSAQAVSVENTQLATLAVQTSEKENIFFLKLHLFRLSTF